MAEPSDSLQVQVPGYPADPDRDLPTSNDTAFDFGADQSLSTLLLMPALQSDDEWLQENISADDTLTSFVHHPPNTCYRNAALMALINITPFINFLRRVEVVPHDSNKLLAPLAQLALTARSPSPSQKTLMELMTRFWDQIGQAPVSNGYGTGPALGFGQGVDLGAQNDPTQFIMYFFERIRSADLSILQIDPGSDYNMPEMFERLFEYTLIARTPFHCKCGNIKRKQRVANRSFVMDLTFSASEQLQEGISRRLRDDIHRDPVVCSKCFATAPTNAQDQVMEFYKLAYLPEVLMFSASYTDSRGRNKSDIRVEFPEILDMSDVRDDPSRHADRNCLYKLQALVVSPNTVNIGADGTVGTHYFSYLRRDETLWTQVNDLGPQANEQVTINFIRSQPYRPRILMYTRLHPTENEAEDQELGDTNVEAGGNEPNGSGAPEHDGAKPVQAGLGDTGGGILRGEANLNPSGHDDLERGDPKTNQPPPELEPEAQETEKDPPQTTAAPVIEELLGPLENDPNLYPPEKSLAPARLMNIIRAAGYRRQRMAGGLRGSLGGIQRSANTSLATSRRNSVVVSGRIS